MDNLRDKAEIMIHALPLDILYTIFHLATKADPHFSIALSHCCSSWRSFTLNTPSLWTTISFVKFREHILGKGGVQIRVASPDFAKQRAYLARSQDLLIDVVIGDEWPKFERGLDDTRIISTSQRTLSRIMRILLPHIDRWKAFRVRNISHKACRAVFDRLSTLDAPSLESLDAAIPPVGGGSKWRFRPFRKGMGTPRLKNLQVGYGVGVNQWTGSLFSSLTTLTLSNSHDQHYPRSKDIISVLSRNPRLESFTLDIGGQCFVHGTPFNPLQPTLLTLPSLHTLCLKSYTYVTYGDFDIEPWIDVKHEMACLLLSLDLPVLTALIPPDIDEPLLGMLASLPNLPFQRLQEISIGSPERTEDLYQILVQLQNLRCLTITSNLKQSESHDWNKHMIQPLCTMLPDLHHLGINHYSNRWVSDSDTISPIEVLQRICTARSLVSDLSNIESVDVRQCSESEEDLAWFEEHNIRVIRRPTYVAVRGSSRSRRRAYMERIQKMTRARLARDRVRSVTPSSVEDLDVGAWDTIPGLDSNQSPVPSYPGGWEW